MDSIAAIKIYALSPSWDLKEKPPCERWLLTLYCLIQERAGIYGANPPVNAAIRPSTTGFLLAYTPPNVHDPLHELLSLRHPLDLVD